MSPYFEIESVFCEDFNPEESVILKKRKLENGRYELIIGGENEIILPFSVDGDKFTLHIEEAEGNLDSVHLYTLTDLPLSKYNEGGYYVDLTFRNPDGCTALEVHFNNKMSRKVEFHNSPEGPELFEFKNQVPGEIRKV